MAIISPNRKRRLEIQGFVGLDDQFLSETAPSRFACGLGAVWLVATGFAFHSGAQTLGYVLGGALTLVGLLVSSIDFCIPSLIYRTIFGFPPKSGSLEADLTSDSDLRETQI